MRRLAPVLLLLVAAILCSCCSSTRPDATAAVRDGVAAAGGGKSDQRQGHLGMGGLAIAEDGNATGGASTRLGVDVQGAANAAANPVTIQPLTGSAGAAAKLLLNDTPEEALQKVRAERIQEELRRAKLEYSLAEGEERATLGTYIGRLEEKEEAVLARLAEIHQGKLDAARELVPDLSSLERVWYSIFAPQITYSGKAGSDSTWEATAEAFKAWLEQQKQAEAEAAAPAGTGG